MEVQTGNVLVVDDIETNRDLLRRRLERQGHHVILAKNGHQALTLIKEQAIDLVLLDIMMPELDGYQVLEQIKSDEQLRHIPVLMISALDNLDSVVRCIEMGAEDYLFKPFNPTLLKARVNACLDRKKFYDREQAIYQQLRIEQEKSERLLLSILPKQIADQLKQNPSTIADYFPEVTVLFADIVGFTNLSSQRSAIDIVTRLNEIFSRFDHLADQHGLEKIKTIGDAYMVVGGLPLPRPDHADAIAEMALDMQSAIAQLNQATGESFALRIGINTGAVVAGVIGTRKFTYDLWGDTVNIASRMESQGIPGFIQTTRETYERLRDRYIFEERGIIEVRGRGVMTTYWLKQRPFEIAA